MLTNWYHVVDTFDSHRIGVDYNNYPTGFRKPGKNMDSDVLLLRRSSSLPMQASVRIFSAKRWEVERQERSLWSPSHRI